MQEFKEVMEALERDSLVYMSPNGEEFYLVYKKHLGKYVIDTSEVFTERQASDLACNIFGYKHASKRRVEWSGGVFYIYEEIVF